jgi:hypothetical protein
MSDKTRGLNTKRSRLVFFWFPRNLSHHMDRQACIGDTMLVKSREMPVWEPNTAVLAGGEGVKTIKVGTTCICTSHFSEWQKFVESHYETEVCVPLKAPFSTVIVTFIPNLTTQR